MALKHGANKITAHQHTSKHISIHDKTASEHTKPCILNTPPEKKKTGATDLAENVSQVYLLTKKPAE